MTNDQCRSQGPVGSIGHSSLVICHWSFGHGAFPEPPPGGVFEAELVPPTIEHLPIEARYAFARHTWRRRHKDLEPVEHAGTLAGAYSCQKMPQRKSIFLPGVCEDGIQSKQASVRRAL